MRKQKSEQLIKLSASAVIEYPVGSQKFVLVEETAPHKKGKINLPGGNKDPIDLTLFDTAIREVKEETGGGDVNDPSYNPAFGLDVEVVGLVPTRPNKPKSNHISHFFAATAVGGLMRATAEHPVVDTYSIDEISTLLDDGLLRDRRVLDAVLAFGLATPISEFQRYDPNPDFLVETAPRLRLIHGQDAVAS